MNKTEQKMLIGFLHSCQIERLYENKNTIDGICKDLLLAKIFSN